jgi:hypothetical protein
LLQFPIIRQIYGKASAYNDEQLIGRGLIVPAIGFVENGEPQTAVIDAADDHVGDRRLRVQHQQFTPTGRVRPILLKNSLSVSGGKILPL